jgi:hypothetical protein
VTTLSGLHHYESLDQLVGRIVRDDARKRDILADTRRISFPEDSTDSVIVDNGADEVTVFTLSDRALGQIATDLKIPKKYFDRMRSDAPDLFRSNVHHWLYTEPTRRMIRGYTQEDGGAPLQGRAWLSDRYRRLDHIEIAKTLLPEFESLGTEVQFHNAAVTEDRMYLRATFPQMLSEVKVGEPVRWGVEIRNSEVGAGMFAINSFVLTLSCMNGMVAYRELSARHVGRRLDEENIFADETLRADDTAFWLAARDTLRASINEARFEEAVATLKAAANSEPVVRPVKASEQLAQRYALTEEEREMVLLSLMSGGDLTQWGMLSAVTRAAKSRESFDRRVEMEEVGWEVAELNGKEWGTIATA